MTRRPAFQVYRGASLGYVGVGNHDLITDAMAFYLVNPNLRQLIGTADELPQIESRINAWNALPTAQASAQP